MALPLLVGMTAAATVFNLLVTFALIRRVRLLQQGRATDDVPPPGHVVGAFRTRSRAGGDLTGADVADALVVFLSPSCAPCGVLADELTARPPEPRPLVFVAGEPDDLPTRELASRLDGTFVVAIVPDSGQVTDAFGVTAFPTVLTVRDGVVRASGHRLRDVAEPRQLARS